MKKAMETTKTVRDLVERSVTERPSVLPGFIGPGITVLAGVPSVGRGNFARAVAMALATDEQFLGVQPRTGLRVLYANTRLSEAKIAQTFSGVPVDKLRLLDDRLRVFTVFGGEGKVRLELTSLVVPSDTEQLFDFVILDDVDRVSSKSRGNLVRDMKEWSWNNNIPFLLISSLPPSKIRVPTSVLADKSNAPFYADTVMVLDRVDAKLNLRVFDAGSQTMHVEISEADWSITGNAAALRQSQSRETILKLLADAPELMRPKEIAIATGLSGNAVDQLLYKMRADEQVVVVTKGQYRHAGRKDLQPKP